MSNTIKTLLVLVIVDLVLSFGVAVAVADTKIEVNYGPALECAAPVGGVSQCTVKATGQKVQCTMVENVKYCY